MAREINPDPLGQFIANVYKYGTETAEQIARAGGGLDPDGGVTDGIEAGSGLTAGAGDAESLGGSALGGVGNAVQSLASRAQQVAGFIQNPASLAQAAIGKITSGIPAIGKIGSLIGGVNNIIGAVRSSNIPLGANVGVSSDSGAAYVEVTPGGEEDWRVKINCNFDLFPGAFDRLANTGGLVWPYLPNITFSSRANYSQMDPVHNNQPFQAYKNSQVEDIQISGDFSVETEADAQYWIQATTFLRTATKMFFGQGANVGNPPVICNLTGYGTRVFNNVPVVIKSFSIELKEDVNYMRYQGTDPSPTWVPVLSTISVTVAPVYNRTRLRKFNLQDFANGRAIGHV